MDFDHTLAVCKEKMGWHLKDEVGMSAPLKCITPAHPSIVKWVPVFQVLLPDDVDHEELQRRWAIPVWARGCTKQVHGSHAKRYASLINMPSNDSFVISRSLWASLYCMGTHGFRADIAARLLISTEAPLLLFDSVFQPGAVIAISPTANVAIKPGMYCKKKMWGE